jgi:hypothetical protein
MLSIAIVDADSFLHYVIIVVKKFGAEPGLIAVLLTPCSLILLAILFSR